MKLFGFFLLFFLISVPSNSFFQVFELSQLSPALSHNFYKSAKMAANQLTASNEHYQAALMRRYFNNVFKVCKAIATYEDMFEMMHFSDQYVGQKKEEM